MKITYAPTTGRGVQNPFTGETKTVREWAEHLDISVSNFYRRMRVYGLKDERTWRVGSLRKNHHLRVGSLRTCPFTKESRTFGQWARFLGHPRSTFSSKYHRNGPHDPRTWTKAGEKEPYWAKRKRKEKAA